MLESLLQSEWLLDLLDTPGKRPAQKLAGLFSTLDTLLPGALSQVKATDAPLQQDRLQQFLTAQARLAGAKLPEMLASQLYFMALSASQEKLNHPASSALLHAQLAAEALIEEQTQSSMPWRTIRNYSVMASLLLIGLSIGYRLYPLHQCERLTTDVALAAAAPAETLPLPLSREASPTETAAIYSRLETMKHGDCRLLEALQLPERLKSIYIENIINGHVTIDREEQILVNQLLDQVQCNYTPKLMANSK